MAKEIKKTLSCSASIAAWLSAQAVKHQPRVVLLSCAAVAGDEAQATPQVLQAGSQLSGIFDAVKW